MAKDVVQIVIQAVDKASKELKGVGKELEDLGGNSKKASINFKQFASTATAVTAAIVAIGVAAKKAYDFAEAGAQMARLEGAGQALARTHGASMDQILRATQQATGGAVSELDLMAAANKAMMLGVTSDADQMADMFAAAGIRARAMGITTTQAVEDIVTGIGRMSPLILDNLGIVTGGVKVFDNYAASVGKTADQLTDAEKKQILLNIVLEDTAVLLDENGELADDVASAYERLGAQSADAGNRFKMEFGRAVEPIIEDLADFLEGTNDLSDALDTLGYGFVSGGDLMDQYGNVVTLTGQEIIELAAAQQEAWDAIGKNDAARQSIELIEELGAAADDAADAVLGIFDIDTSIISKLDKMMEQIVLYGLGWQDVENYIKDVATAVDNASISTDAATYKMELAAIAALRIQQEAGLITFDQAAESLENTLGRELSTAYATYLALGTPFDITSHQTIITHHVTSGAGGPGQGSWSSDSGTSEAYRREQNAAALRALKDRRRGTAAGGDVAANRPILIGEHGPEMFAPSVPGSITPNHRIGSAGRGGGTGVTVVYSPQISFATEDEVQRTLVPMIQRALRQVQGF